MLITDMLAKTDPEATAVNHPDSGAVVSYRQLSRLVDDYASGLQASGLQAGDSVVVVSENTVWMVAAVLAIAQCGAVAVPVNPASAVDEIAYYLSDSEAALTIVSDTVASQLASLPAPVAVLRNTGELDRDQCLRRRRQAAFSTDACLMIYTSGTTSRPKGVPLTHGNLQAAMTAFASAFQLTASDTTLVPMPLFHVHGLIGGTLSTLFSGGKVVLQSRFSASKFFRQMQEHKVTWYSSSPTIHRILLARAAEDCAPRGQLRFIRSSSASLGVDTLRQMEETFGTVVLEAYGMTETANQIACNPLPPGKRKEGSVGLACGLDTAILNAGGELASAWERGEIVVRGASVMHGYHNKPEANAASFHNGWLRTGDDGYMDADGYLYIAGRIKELINRGGEKISPAEVEEVLLRHPVVVEAACFGVPHPKYGEEVSAAVVLKQPVETNELIEFCARHLSNIKIPKRIHIVDSLPRTPTNKVQRQLLINRFST